MIARLQMSVNIDVEMDTKDNRPDAALFREAIEVAVAKVEEDRAHGEWSLSSVHISNNWRPAPRSVL